MAESVLLVATAVGDLRIPSDPHGVVMVAGDTEATRVVRETLHHSHFATLQLSGVSLDSSPTMEVRRRTEQLLEAADLIRTYPDLEGLRTGIFAADASGGAALAAASERPGTFRALVLRDGHPQVTGRILNRVRAATLLIVDGQNDRSIALNQEMMTKVNGIAELEILAGSPATYDDPLTLTHVAHLARRWFDRFLS